MVHTKIVTLELRKENFFTKNQKGKWHQNYWKPSCYRGWYLWETEKSYCLLLMRVQCDKYGNIYIPEKEIALIENEKRHKRHALSKRYYKIIEERKGPSIDELLTSNSEYIRKLALQYMEKTQ